MTRPRFSTVLLATLIAGSANAQDRSRTPEAEIVGLQPDQAQALTDAVREHCAGKY